MVRYREGNGLTISLTLLWQFYGTETAIKLSFCMFACIRICRVLTGQNLVPQHFWISHHRPRNQLRNGAICRNGGGVWGLQRTNLLNANARELPLIHAVPYLNNVLLKYCEVALTDRRGISHAWHYATDSEQLARPVCP